MLVEKVLRSPREAEEAEMVRRPTREVALPFLSAHGQKEETHITEPSPVPGTMLTPSVILVNPCN